MTKRGPMSSAELAMSGAIASVSKTDRLACPVHLSDAIRSVWLDLVGDLPADSFTAKDAPMLEQYCRHIVQARILADQIEQFDPAWLGDDDGLKRYDRLLGAHEREGRAASSLATRLRISRQAMADAKTVGRANVAMSRAKKPWEVSGE
jgi:hypothetical protein